MAEIVQTFDSKEYTFADINLMLGGQMMVNITSVEYKETAKKNAIYGKSVYPVAIQRGQRSYSGTLKMLQSEYETLVRHSPKHDILSLHVDAVIVYGNPERGDVLITDILHGIEFTEDGKSISNQNDNMEVSLPFIFLSKVNQAV